MLPTLSRDLVLAIDISGSMGQGDMSVGGKQYTRLAIVKHAVQDFVEKRDGDRIGIVLFGSVPYVYVPLTPDVSTASQMLTDAPIGIAGRSTAIGDSLGLAIKQILNHPADHRVVVLMTDGVNNFGELEPMDAAELAAASDVTVYTIGIVPPTSSLGFFAPFQRQTDAVDEEVLQSRRSQRITRNLRGNRRVRTNRKRRSDRTPSACTLPLPAFPRASAVRVNLAALFSKKCLKR